METDRRKWERGTPPSALVVRVLSARGGVFGEDAALRGPGEGAAPLGPKGPQGRAGLGASDLGRAWRAWGLF